MPRCQKFVCFKSWPMKGPRTCVLKSIAFAVLIFATLVSSQLASAADDTKSGGRQIKASLRMPDGTTEQLIQRGPTQEDLERWVSQKRLPVVDRVFALNDYSESSEFSNSFGAVPLTLAEGDFTQDGISDLLTGYQTGNLGVITLREGLVEALIPTTADWSIRPVIPFGNEKMFSVPISPTEIVTGDFNNDGLLDVVISNHQKNGTFYIPGHSKTILGEPELISLPGRSTALLSADLGRKDFLSNLIIATEQNRKVTIWIYQNPSGAFSGPPDQLQVNEEVVAMQAGRIDADSFADLVIATARQLITIYGTNGGVGTDQKTDSNLKMKLDFTPDQMILANLSGIPQTSNDIVFISKQTRGVEVFRNSNDAASAAFQNVSISSQAASAFVTAELNGEAPKELILFDRFNSQLSILKGSKDVIFTSPNSYATDAAPIAVLPMRLNPTAIDVLVVLKADGALSLMSPPPGAIIAVDTVADDITNNGTANGVITLREAILLSNGGTLGDGITTGLNRALTTGACPGAFETCYISGAFGFGVADLIVFDNTTFGAGGVIRVSGPASLRPLPPVRDSGTTIDAISACPVAVPNCSDIPPGPVTITPGLNLAAANDGLSILSSYNVIRGLNITFFPDDGIEILSGTGNTIEACKIGVAGANTGDAIDDSGFSTMIGGTTAAQSNTLSGNLDNGILGRSPGLTVKGNFIGTDPTGTSILSNGLNGIRLEAAATDAVIGGPGAGNVISGNGNGISSASNNALIQANLIGRDATNSVDLPNGADGINISGRLNLIGGTAAGVDNAIRGNILDGVQLSGTNNTVEGNDTPGAAGFFIGGNGRHGVYVVANTTTVGGGAIGEGNLVAGNLMAGVRLESSTSSVVQGNTITGNGQDGVQLDSASNTNTIGGTLSGTENIIDSNGGAGVSVLSGTGNAILSNSVFANAGLAIDLGTIGVNPNDTGDGDAGPNNLQNYPILTAAVTASSTVVMGTLNGQNSSSFTIQFYSNATCDPSGYGEAEAFRGSALMTTNNTGNGSFIVTLPTIVPVGEFITATATHSTNNTSEFSACILVTSCPVISLTPPPLPDGTVGVPYSTTIVASSGVAPYTYSISAGALPAGLTLAASTGVISGTPLSPGLFSFDITATDSTGCTGSQSYTINVICGTIALTAPPLPNGFITIPYNKTITAAGGTGPYTFLVTAGSTPPGITLASDGILSGTPTVIGSFDFSVTATDSLGCTGVQDYTIVVQTLLIDDFEDGTFTWDVVTGTWSESGGNLVATAKGTAFAPVPWNPSGVAGCSVCTIHVEDIVSSGVVNVTIIGWFVDDDNKVELIFKKGKLTLRQIVAGQILLNSKISLPLVGGVPFDVDLSFDGTNFQVMVDGSLVLSAPAASVPSGKIGLTTPKKGASFGEVRVE